MMMLISMIKIFFFILLNFNEQINIFSNVKSQIGMLNILVKNKIAIDTQTRWRKTILYWFKKKHRQMDVVYKNVLICTTYKKNELVLHA